MTAGLNQLLRFGLTALAMLALKLGLTHLFALFLAPLVSYLVVQGILTITSYLTHARFTFRRPREWGSFLRYARVIIFFQGLDYLIFAVLLAGLGVAATPSILAATLVVFLLRFLAVRRSFLPAAASPAGIRPHA